MNRLGLMLTIPLVLIVTILACVLYFVIWIIFFCCFIFYGENDFWVTFEKLWRAIPKPVNEEKCN